MTNNGQTPGGNTTTAGAVERLREARSLLQYARPLVGIARSMSDAGTADSARLLCQRIDAFLSDTRAAHLKGHP